MVSHSSRRILITGGAGFIGYHLARALCEQGDNRMVLVDNFARGRADQEWAELLQDPRIELVSGDLTDPCTYDQLGDGFDEIYHLAAVLGVQNVLQRPYHVIRVNALATLQLLDWYAAGDNGKLLFASTSEAYAWTQQFHPLPIPTPESVPLALTDLGNARSSYAGSKIFGELAVTHCGLQCDRPFAIVRYHNVYGPRMGLEHVIPELFARMQRGEDPLVVYSVQHQRAFCYVSDAVEATILAMRCEAADGRTLNVGNDQEEIQIGQLARRIVPFSSRRPELISGEAPNDPISRRCPDISLARATLDYQPRVNLDQGLQQTLAWYRKNLNPTRGLAEAG